MGNTVPVGNDVDRHGSSPALRETEMMRAALSASGTGAWQWDRASGEVVWDDTMEGLCGLEPGSFGGDLDSWRATVHPEDRAWVADRLIASLTGPGPFAYEHRVLRPDGSLAWLEIRGRVVTDADGEVVGTVGCAFDICER